MIIYREVSTLALDLGISSQALYAVSNRLSSHYRRVEIPKGDGTYRRLSIPDNQLKSIQRRITEKLLVYMPVSPYACAYKYGARTSLNAAPHIGKRQILKLDIRHFFDSILYCAVKDTVFPADRFSEPVRILLAMLCYYDDSLPQGAPSSPAITNILMRDFDNIIGCWCRERSIAYTRYCDDMTFSGDFDADELRLYVAERLREKGFFLNPRKTKLLTSSQQQIVTGLVVNEKLGVPAQYRRKLRQELYFCQKFGVQSHLERIGSALCARSYLESLLGKVNYILQIMPDNSEMCQYRDWLKAQMQDGSD